MSDKSAIEWTDATWPVVQGCDPVSQGCVNCYAVPLLWRMGHHPNPQISGPVYGLVERYTPRGGEPILRFTGKLALREDRLDWPLKWKKPRMIFVPSHGDIFHKDVPDDFLDRIFAVMALCPQHTFQVLTKRAERMHDYCNSLGRHHSIDRVSLAMKRYHPKSPGAFYTLGGKGWHFANVWLGISAEDQPNADERLPFLINTPAAIRFMSYEPAIGPMLLQHHDLHGGKVRNWLGKGGLDWVIDGGESGSDPRPYDLDASRDLQRQCQAAGVAYFRKQLGARPFERKVSDWPNHIAVGEDAHGRIFLSGFKNKKAGDLSEWPEDLRVREFPSPKSQSESTDDAVPATHVELVP